MKHKIIGALLTLGFTNAAIALEAADTVYTNGKIYTVEESQPWVEAIAVTGDRFVFVGSKEDAQSYVGPKTKVVDLDGRLVTPGLYDMHTHIDLLLEPKYTDQIQTLPLGPKELKEAILKFAADERGDGWIFGGTWAPDAFLKEGVEPNAAYLDSFMPDRPVAILSTSRHNMLVNSLGLKLAGIDKRTFEPDHGHVARDADGNPTGFIADGAQSLLGDVLPQADWQQMKEMYREGQAMLNQYGIVATRSMHTNTTRLKAVQSLERDNALTARFDMATSWKNDIYIMVPDRAELITGERFRYMSKHVNSNYVKFHLDGTPASKTALYLAPYKGTDNHGKSNETWEELKALLVQLDLLGIGANIHVVGDGSANMALDAFEHVRKVNGPKGARHMLAHTFFLHDEQAKRVAELNIAAEFTHYPARDDMVDFFAYNLGLLDESVLPSTYNMKKVLESGGHAVLGSDLVCPPDPNVFASLPLLMNRTDYKEKSITAEEALKMLTINGAWAMGREDEAGSIRVGKYADFIVLDRNLFEIPVTEVAGTKVLKTVFEGKEVYSQKDG